MLDPFFIIPRIGRLAYLNNPKAACSSVLLALSRMRQGNNFQPPQILLSDGSHPIHGFHPEYAHLEYFFRRWPLSYPPLPASIIKFSFVRNPYARFYSFYKSKVLSGQSPGKYYERFGIEKGCSFEKCVKIITSTDPLELEHHAAPQSMILCNGDGILVDFIGRVEDFAKDWLVINNLIGFVLQLDHVNKTSNSSEAIYSAEAKERIYDYYRDDFDLFRYDKDSILLTNDVTENFDALTFQKHHLHGGIINELKNAILISNEKVRLLADEFARSESKREEFFGNYEEFFRELLLKASFVIDAKADENSKIQSSLKKNESIISNKIEMILKSNISYKEKFTEINKILRRLNNDKEEIQRRLNKVKEDIQKRLIKDKEQIQKRLNKEKEEIARTKNLLYQHVLSTFRQARRSRWKSLCRLLRSPRLNEAKLLRNSGLVDPHYYFESYPNTIKPGMTASEHYVHIGAQDGNNPSAQFNTKQYLAENPDAAHDGINPLVHFILKKQG